MNILFTVQTVTVNNAAHTTHFENIVISHFAVFENTAQFTDLPHSFYQAPTLSSIAVWLVNN
jgi:hypothetical protein